MSVSHNKNIKTGILRTNILRSGFSLLSTILLCAHTIAAEQPGNELNPAGLEPGVGNSTDGVTLMYPNNSRSPSGLLYPPAPQPRTFAELGQTSWLYRSYVAAGYLANADTTDTGSFLEYGDLSEGFLLSNLGFEAINPDSASYFQFNVGAAGRDDEYYLLEGGKYGTFKAGAYFTGIPHTFSTNARILFNGAGTGNLTLPAGIPAGGGASADQVRNVINQTQASTLQIQRDEAGVYMKYQLSRDVKVHAELSNERRQGSRSFGGTFAYPLSGQVMETVEPVDYDTTEVIAGLSYSQDRLQANIAYTGSFFQNHIEALTFENPGVPSFSGSFVPNRGQFALAPDNSYHSLRADLAQVFTKWSGRFNATLAYSRSRQDARLLPPTVSTGLGGLSAFPINFDLWNTTDALSQARADASMDTVTAQLQYAIRPTPKLGVRMEVRVRNEDNDTDYRALNPLTGEFGFPALDGGLAATAGGTGGIFRPTQPFPGTRVRIRSMPVETDRGQADLTFDYRLRAKTKLNLRLRHRQTQYAHRERSEVNDNEVRLELSNRNLNSATIRVSYSYLDRSGDRYNPNPFEPFYSSSLPEFQPTAAGRLPHTLAEMRKFDLADKSAHNIRTQFHFLLSEVSDLQLTANYSDDDFDAAFGLDTSTSLTLNAEWSYQFSKASDLFLYYSYQSHEREVRNVNDLGRLSTNGNIGGDLYPLSSVWSQAVEERNHAAGGGYTTQLGPAIFKADYTYSYANSALGYSFASPLAFFNSFTAEQAGDGFPDQLFENHIVQASLTWPVNEKLSLGFFYRFEKENLDDFHYQGLTDPVLRGAINMLAVPEDFSAHIFSTQIKYSF